MSAPYIDEEKYKPKYGRLDKSDRAWCSDVADSRLSITLPAKTTVFGVATQGHPSLDHWVTKYRLRACSTHAISLVTDNDYANTDRNTIVNYMVESSPPCVDGVLRFLPMDWEGNKRCARLEIYGINEG